MSPNSFCHKCGTAYTKFDWPRICGSCGTENYRRVNPVAVVLQPVYTHDENGTRLGILLGRRGIQPSLGVFGLPGGFVEFNEQPEIAAVRELNEEMGFNITVDDLFYSHSYTDDQGHMLLFFRARAKNLEDLGKFIPSLECTEMMIAYKPMSLAFQSHTEALAMMF